MNNAWSFETRQIHAGQTPGQRHQRARPADLPDHVATPSTAPTHAANLFALKEFGNIYTRIMNPTQAAVEERIASLEGGVGALLVASGQAAETLALLNIAEAGDHIVVQPEPLRRHVQPVPLHVPEAGHRGHLRRGPRRPRAAGVPRSSPNTKAFFAETISNPKNDILDIEGVAGVAHEAGVPLVVDNTVATPYLIRPIECGADIVVHSATKYLGGHGTAIAGAIVDCGQLRLRRRPRAVPELQPAGPELPRPGLRPRPRRGQRPGRQPGVHPQGPRAAAARPRQRGLAVQRLPHRPGPRDAVSLRIERHVANAKAVAEWLETRDEVETVNYAVAAEQPVVRAGPQVRPAGHRRRAVLRDQGRRRGRHARSSRRSSCTATWPTSATCAAS